MTYRWEGRGGKGGGEGGGKGGGKGGGEGGGKGGGVISTDTGGRWDISPPCFTHLHHGNGAEREGVNGAAGPPVLNADVMAADGEDRSVDNTVPTAQNVLNFLHASLWSELGGGLIYGNTRHILGGGEGEGQREDRQVTQSTTHQNSHFHFHFNSLELESWCVFQAAL